eukprot:TRINITY_DN61877_c0_g1_i1.p1 TRINITY_DN61877_c0_g1~~TRINITY_DN61877_c0_g1_i1.p1  ORF type:complete len:330 (+),score=45.94 TRINITY_DN61877_c0_g1_i1:161-1150(+)
MCIRDRSARVTGCVIPSNLPESAFPGYIKYAHGVHGTGGWGGACLRHLSVVRSLGEMERKLPFFCGKGITSYHYLETPEQRSLFMAPYRFGMELAVEVIVYRGRPIEIIYQAGLYSCNKKMVHTFPAHAPGLDQNMKSKCNRLVGEIVTKMKIWNMVVGVQLMYDWRLSSPQFGCQFIEVNFRAHDWDIISDHSFGSRHFRRWFDYGAVSTYLALDLDPTPLIWKSPPAYSSGLVVICPLSETSAGGFMSHKQLYQSWMKQPKCKFAVAETVGKAYVKVVEEMPCVDGPVVHDVGPDLERICVADLRKDLFWWSNGTAILKDIQALNNP